MKCNKQTFNSTNIFLCYFLFSLSLLNPLSLSLSFCLSDLMMRNTEMQEPYAIAVLLQNDLVLIDLLTPGFPCFESPYPMDIHESPVTCCTYLADCPSDLVPAFYMVGLNPNTRKTGQSERQWPISGGEWSPASCSYFEIIITGHQDGSIKFWDSSAGTLQILYKLKTAKIFERPRTRSLDGNDEDPLAVQIISLCAESRRLCVAGASGHVILFKFKKTESVSENLVSGHFFRWFLPSFLSIAHNVINLTFALFPNRF